MSETDADPSRAQQLLTWTAQIVAAHVGGNAVTASALPSLIQSVHTALATAGTEQQPTPAERKKPAVPIRRSIQQDYLVCLEDGAKVKMLKRYIAKRYGLTPAQYREKWGLPSDYPMVAPAYAERRSALAKEIGLGRKKAAEPARAKGRASTATAAAARTGKPGPTPGSGRKRRTTSAAGGAPSAK